MPNQLDEIKNACAYIDAGEMRGTGYLVAPNIAVTCNHVVNRVSKYNKPLSSSGLAHSVS